MLLQRANAGARRHAIIRAGFWQLSATAAASLCGLCSLALITRTTGPGLFGQYAFAMWLATAAAIVARVGIPTLSNRRIADIQSRAKPEALTGIFYFVARWHYRKMALYSVLVLLLVLPCAKFFGTNTMLPLLPLAMLSLLPRLSGSVVALPLRGLRRFDLLTAIHLLEAAITLLLLLVILQASVTGMQQTYLFLLAPLVAGIVATGTSLFCARAMLPLTQPRRLRGDVQEQLARGLHQSFLPAILDAIVWQHAELLAVGRVRSGVDLGYYILCVTVSAGMMQALPILYTTCILPFRLRVMPYRHSLNAIDAYARTTLGLAWLVMPVCTLSIVCCPALIGLCFGPAYLPAVIPMQILLAATAFGSISSVSVTQLAVEQRKQAQVWLSAAGATLTLALAWPLTAYADITGAAIASAVAQGVCATGTMFICIRKMRSRKGA